MSERRGSCAKSDRAVAGSRQTGFYGVGGVDASKDRRSLGGRGRIRWGFDPRGAPARHFVQPGVAAQGARLPRVCAPLTAPTERALTGSIHKSTCGRIATVPKARFCGAFGARPAGRGPSANISACQFGCADRFGCHYRLGVNETAHATRVLRLPGHRSQPAWHSARLQRQPRRRRRACQPTCH
jgi:hypothetical protein